MADKHPPADYEIMQFLHIAILDVFCGHWCSGLALWWDPISRSMLCLISFTHSVLSP